MQSILPNLNNMTFVDHDLWKFLELATDKYIVSVKDTADGPMRLVPMEWARGLDKAGLLSLMYLSHFGRSTDVNVCVKQFLVSFHGGFLWLDWKVYVSVNLLAAITGLPLAGIDLEPFFVGKEQDNLMKNKLKYKYDMTKNTKGFFIASINDHTIRFFAKVLARKLLPNMREHKCTVGMIIAAELCAIGVQLNWSQYLLNELLADAKES